MITKNPAPSSSAAADLPASPSPSPCGRRLGPPSPSKSRILPSRAMHRATCARLPDCRCRAAGYSRLSACGRQSRAQAQPILDMVAHRQPSFPRAVRPTYLSFAGEVAPKASLSHTWSRIGVLTSAAVLDESAQARHRPCAPRRSRESRRGRSVIADDALPIGGTLTDAIARRRRRRDARRLREASRKHRGTMAGTTIRPAFVTTVAHERDHEGRRHEEHFLPAGPFANLAA